MPRKGPVSKRRILPDPVYGSELAQRFINRMMLDGKKSVSERIFYSAMANLEQKTGEPAIEVFERAMQNVMPNVEVRPRRVGGQTYQVPMDVRPERRRALALRWLIESARKRSGNTMVDRLTSELLDAANGTGVAVKKREDTHRMADANKAFSHYRF
ncbi:MAG: 30S ribosomal protein S7 [Armatimonadetes bacterium]|uniref:Small ribosomal subunit protein uS7 n=1 Tax=Candidatus Nitrosymbiomonas proteolyticus TaxID=2608984 RepID=A0A809R9C3_9BACT|nr:MAG: 30S ribosomal protein S7 [Armatimonadota bacterium]MCK6631666.1 30S ribosomal protein S7 [Fimbriimonadaceae bacterium]BBO24090.1 30S ribosomal protein S7 [Candidatus Nitrosymbiomonas proteolyticus]MBL1151454.1 30S ribosomal protein S7 [Armatimonadota bacterium]MCZ7581165.1 30S ribosomal protein S7 [Fimbriimonadaceae bacterium]